MNARSTRRPKSKGMLKAVLVLLIVLSLAGGAVGYHALGPYMPLVVSMSAGGSMFPTARSGDLIVAVSRLLKPVQVGDIVLYRLHEGGPGASRLIVAHRVVKIEDGYATVRGDNNIVDERVPLSRVTHVVVLTLPPYVWVPVFGALAALTGLHLTARASRSHMYSTLAIIYYALFAAGIVAIVLVYAGAPIPGYDYVKPNPMPLVGFILLTDDTLVVGLKPVLPGSVECRAGPEGEQIPCMLADGGVRVDASALRRHCGAPGYVELTVVYRVDTQPSVTIRYPIKLSICDGG